MLPPASRLSIASRLSLAPRKRLASRAVLAGICFAAVLLPSPILLAQQGPLTALENKYKITQPTLNHDQIADPGTVMEIQAHGINSEPWGGLITFDNPVVDGKVQQRGTGIRMLSGGLSGTRNLHILQPGDKVYITKMEIKPDSKFDVLRMVILTTDPLDVDGGASQKRYSAGLSFRFPKDSFAQSSPDELEHTIEAVLSPSTGDDKNAAPATNTAAAAPAPAPAPAPPPHTATINIGETTEQVIAAMGLPLQVIDLGSKKIYQYKDLKITFVDNKVKDVS